MHTYVQLLKFIQIFFNTSLLLCCHDSPNLIRGTNKILYNSKSEGAPKQIKDSSTGTKGGFGSHHRNRNGQHITGHVREDGKPSTLTFQ